MRAFFVSLIIRWEHGVWPNIFHLWPSETIDTLVSTMLGTLDMIKIEKKIYRFSCRIFLGCVCHAFWGPFAGVYYSTWLKAFLPLLAFGEAMSNDISEALASYSLVVLRWWKLASNCMEWCCEWRLGEWQTVSSIFLCGREWETKFNWQRMRTTDGFVAAVDLVSVPFDSTKYKQAASLWCPTPLSAQFNFDWFHLETTTDETHLFIDVGWKFGWVGFFCPSCWKHLGQFEVKPSFGI